MELLAWIIGLALLALLISSFFGGRHSDRSGQTRGPVTCRVCGGAKRVYDTPDGSGRPCPECGGTGKKHN